MKEIIKYYDIEAVLRKTSHLTPIKIERWGDLQTVYLNRVTNTGIWARNQYEEESIRIWPQSLAVKMLKIGSRNVQSYEEFQQEKRDYYDMLSCIAKEEKRKIYLDAYRHAKVLGGD